ncbi:MAG: hypothetical protein HZB16_22330 [Armatimonadetes bacterium]|nr:hypothetical protein [Armatimonadota bacterium]
MLRGCLLLTCCLASIVAGAAPTTYPLRYRFAAGDVLTYETKTSALGKLAVQVNGENRHAPLPVGLDICDRTRYEVKAMADDGVATVEIRLMFLSGGSSIPGQFLLELERLPDGVLIKRGDAQWKLPPPEAGKPTPADLLEAFGGWDPMGLLQPCQVTITPAGLTTAKTGAPWVKHLATLPSFGQLAAYFQPFGQPLPELPGRSLELGQEWEQPRAVPLPGVGAKTYRLDVLFALANRQTVGPFETVKISFDGATTLQDEPIRLTVPGSGPLDLKVQSLTHRLTGAYNLAPEQGRLVDHSLRSEANCQSRGGPADSIFIDSNIVVEAAMNLLAP